MANPFKLLAGKYGFEYAEANIIPGANPLMVIGKVGAKEGARILEKKASASLKKSIPSEDMTIVSKLPKSIESVILQYLSSGGKVQVSSNLSHVRFYTKKHGWSDGYYDFLPKGWRVTEGKTTVTWSKRGAKKSAFTHTIEPSMIMWKRQSY